MPCLASLKIFQGRNSSAASNNHGRLLDMFYSVLGLVFWLLSVSITFLCSEIFVFSLFLSLNGKPPFITEVKNFRPSPCSSSLKQGCWPMTQSLSSQVYSPTLSIEKLIIHRTEDNETLFWWQ